MGRTAHLAATRVAALFLIALGCASACGDSGDSKSGGGSSVWAPTTVPFDPTCKDCEEVGKVNLPHMGEARLMANSRVDDPTAQWTRCVNGILDCIEETRDESACVAKSSCPGPCKADYKTHLSALGHSELADRWAALRAVFEAPTSRCALPSNLNPEVTP
ncbi:MAG: hypothetical protein IPI67_34425 [Myxococcales bacterium]|nr:hypothetical protein [Myxococcales bacterium]